MSFNPVSGLLDQYQKTGGTFASGFFLRFQAAGTSTDINMATDSTGGTLLSKCEVDTDGYFITALSARFVPHIDQSYKATLYPTEADADNKANGVWEVDGLIPIPDLATDTVASTQVTYTAPYTGSALRTGNSKWAEYVTPEDFEGDDDTRVAAAFAASNRVRFNEGVTYDLTTLIAKATNGLYVIAEGAIINVDGAAGASGFFFGSSATDSEPNFKDFSWRGGKFTNNDGTEDVNRGFIKLAGIGDFEIDDIELNEVANGGVEILVGCRDGDINRVRVISYGGNSFRRGIWLNASGATDYAPQLVDVSAIDRNATALPVGGIRNVNLHKCTSNAQTADLASVNAYGIYLQNARNTTITSPNIDVRAGGLRGITVNNFSPNTKVLGGLIKSSAAAANTGILFTQYSYGGLVDGVTFEGDFSLGRSIASAYLAETEVRSCKFYVDDAIPTAIWMGGVIHAHHNEIAMQEGSAAVGNNRCMRIHGIGDDEVDLSGYGDTATILKASTFENNKIYRRSLGVQVTQQASKDDGRVPGFNGIISQGNTYFDWNAVNSAEFEMFVQSLSQDSGTTDGTTANKLVDSTQTFDTNIEIDMTVHNTTQDTYTKVTAVDSASTLSLDDDIMRSGETYTIVFAAVVGSFNNTALPAFSGSGVRNQVNDASGFALNVNRVAVRGDYQWGTWEPNVVDGSLSTGEGQTYSLRVGEWERENGWCEFTATVTLTSLGTLTTSQFTNIITLPFLSKVLTGQDTAVTVKATGLGMPAATSLVGLILEGTSRIKIFVYDETGGSSELTLAELSATGSLTISGKYPVDDY